MAKNKWPSLDELGMLPFMGIAAVANKLGQSESLLRLITRQMQSPKRKRGVFGDYRPTNHDLFICTYAKSGTNWGMQIAQQIAYYGQADFAHIHDLVPWPDKSIPVPIVSLEDPGPRQQSPTGLRIIKTHLESEYVPYDDAAKYIVVLRDPKDVFVSSYYFGMGLIRGVMKLDYGVAEWLAQFTSDHFFFDSWAAHVASYWPWRQRQNVLILNFQELKDDLRASCGRIGDLMNVRLSDTQLALVVEKSSFHYMKDNEGKFMLQIPTYGRYERPTLVRKGKSGTAGELLNDEQQKVIDDFCQSELQRLGSEFPYQAMFAKKEFTDLNLDEIVD